MRSQGGIRRGLRGLYRHKPLTYFLFRRFLKKAWQKLCDYGYADTLLFLLTQYSSGVAGRFLKKAWQKLCYYWSVDTLLFPQTFYFVSRCDRRPLPSGLYCLRRPIIRVALRPALPAKKHHEDKTSWCFFICF